MDFKFQRKRLNEIPEDEIPEDKILDTTKYKNGGSINTRQ